MTHTFLFVNFFLKKYYFFLDACWKNRGLEWKNGVKWRLRRAIPDILLFSRINLDIHVRGNTIITLGRCMC